MANEWIKVELTNQTGNPRRFSVASGVSITKGSVLKLVDARVASYACTTSNAIIAGVASMDKDGTDGSTSISVYTDGIFEAKCSGAVNCGAPVIMEGHNSNKICACSITVSSGAQIVGYALEDGAHDEVINVRLRL